MHILVTNMRAIWVFVVCYSQKRVPQNQCYQNQTRVFSYISLALVQFSSSTKIICFSILTNMFQIWLFIVIQK